MCERCATVYPCTGLYVAQVGGGRQVILGVPNAGMPTLSLPIPYVSGRSWMGAHNIRFWGPPGNVGGAATITKYEPGPEYFSSR